MHNIYAMRARQQVFPKVESPYVSCILPIFNEDFVERAISSITAQSYSNYELIIVDARGRTDNGIDLLALVGADERLSLICGECNDLSEALNIGLRYVRGEYVAIMDQYCISARSRFEFQSSFLETHPTCVMVGGLAESICGARNRSSYSHQKFSKVLDLNRFPPSVASVFHPMSMVRHSALNSIGGYRSLFPQAEDWDLFIRLAAYGSIDNPHHIVGTYSLPPSNTSKEYLYITERYRVAAEAYALYEHIYSVPPDPYQPLEAVITKVWSKTIFNSYVFLRFNDIITAWNPELKGEFTSALVRIALNRDLKTFLSKEYYKLRFIALRVIIRNLY